MGKFFVRRLLQMIPLLLGVSVMVFMIMKLAPGNPLSTLTFGQTKRDPAYVAKRMQELGLNDDLHIQYINWLKQTASGNLGYSIRFQRPVAELIKERLPQTLLLTCSALVLSIVIAVPMGVISAIRQYSWFDQGLGALAIMGISLPSFFAALVAIYVFGWWLGWLPLGGIVSPGQPDTLLMRLRHLILPATVFAVRGLAVYTRFTRSSMLEVIRQDFIRSARAKGLAQRLVVYKHALRNALIPVVTLFGFELPNLFAGAVILEQVFAWPGIGKLSVDAITVRDYPILMATNMILALLTLFGSLLADILYAIVDPRIRYS